MKLIKKLQIQIIFVIYLKSTNLKPEIKVRIWSDVQTYTYVRVWSMGIIQTWKENVRDIGNKVS